MDNQKKIIWARRAVTLVADIVLAAVIAVYRYNNPPWGNDSIPVIWAVSDALFVVGLINFGFGALLWISTTGFFDILAYGFKSLIYLFTPIKKNRDEGGYYEYKVAKKEKRKKVPFEVLWIGAAMLIAGIICNVLIYL